MLVCFYVITPIFLNIAYLFSDQRGGDALWYYQSQKLKPEEWRKFLEREVKPSDFPP